MGTRGKLLALGALFIVVAAIHTPSIQFGWFGDDYFHRHFILKQLAGQPLAGEHRPAWWNMFDTRVPSDRGGPDPETLLGRLPWWASPDYQFSHLRPLSTASHFVDYLLWPERPWAMHVHNVVLFAAILTIASSLYQRMLGSSSLSAGWPAALATVMFAIDDSSSSSAAWIASRNTVLTVLLVLLTVWLHDRSARGARGARSARVGAPVVLLLAHASSEGAVVAWGYLAAYAACIDRRTLAERVRSLAPLAAVSLAWLALAAALGYGVRGSSVYIDPRVDPGAFAAALPQRWLSLLEMQLVLSPMYFELRGEALGIAGMLAVHAYLALLLCAALWAARGSRAVAFFALATVLTIIPQCATDSMGRLLMLSSFAAHGLTAGVVGAVLGELRGKTRALAVAAATCALGFLHGWVALDLPPRGFLYASSVHQAVLRAAESLPSGAELRGSTIMTLSYPDYLSGIFIGVYRQALFAPGPERMHVLSATRAPLRLSRTHDGALRLEADGSLLDPTTAFARRIERRFAPGDRFDLHEARVEVAAVASDGAPTVLIVRTSPGNRRPLLWMGWNELSRRFERVDLPDPGQSISIGSAAR